MPYKRIQTLEELKDYLAESHRVAFDLLTAPNTKHRSEKYAPADSLKRHVVGFSFSTNEDSGVYLPLEHLAGENAIDKKAVWGWLADFFTNPQITKITHNLVIKSQYLYAYGVVIQEPCYDTFAAAQLSYDKEDGMRVPDDCKLKALLRDCLEMHIPSYENTTGGRYFDELDPSTESVVRYACTRSDYPLRLYKHFNYWFNQRLPKHRLVVEKIDSPSYIYEGITKHNEAYYYDCMSPPQNSGILNNIIAPKGSAILALNFPQLDFRVGAFYCKDENLLEIFQKGKNVHAFIASRINDITIEEASDTNHPKCNTRLAIAEACDLDALSVPLPIELQKKIKTKSQHDIELSECETIISKLKISYPRLFKWMKDEVRQAGFRKYAETWFGRRKSISKITSSNWNKKALAESTVINTIVNGTATDIIKLFLGRIIKGLPDRPWLRPILQDHDRLVFEIPETEVQNTISFIKNCMRSCPSDDFSIPITISVSIGKSLNELKNFNNAS